MNKQLSKLVVTLLTASLAPAVFAATLNDLKIASLPGDKVELKLIFDEPVMEPKGYTIERPARIALDLPGVTSQLTSKTREIVHGKWT